MEILYQEMYKMKGVEARKRIPGSKQEGWKVNCKMSRENMEKRGPEGAKEAAKAGQALAE